MQTQTKHYYNQNVDVIRLHAVRIQHLLKTGAQHFVCLVARRFEWKVGRLRHDAVGEVRFVAKPCRMINNGVRCVQRAPATLCVPTSSVQ